MRLLPVFVLLLVAAGAVIWSCVFIVTEKQQALLLAFGKYERTVTEPGLHFKYPQPFNTVVTYDDRILPLESTKLEVTPKDNRRLEVVAFARFRISDPKKFFEAVTTLERGQGRLRDILITELRKVLGSVGSDEVLSEERATLMRRIRDLARAQASDFGVTVVDVRIKSADLPPQNLKATYERMEAERKQAAADEIARGKEAAQARRALADREALEIKSEAGREALIIQGDADAQRARITAEAFGKDAEFFDFYRSLQAYEKTLKSQSSYVITPGGQLSDFFEQLGQAAPTE